MRLQGHESEIESFKICKYHKYINKKINKMR